MPPPLIRILIVDDHFMMRMGLRGALSRERDFQVIGEARTGHEALELFDSLLPDVTLIDGILPDIHGVEVTRRIRVKHPAAQIILISINETAEDIHRAIEAGASGYLSKSSEQPETVRAVRTVAAGRQFLPAELGERLAERNRHTPLSERELDVLRLVAQGRSNKEIATLLGLGEGTVKTHLKHLVGKLGVPDRTRAATLAIERGLLRM